MFVTYLLLWRSTISGADSLHLHIDCLPDYKRENYIDSQVTETIRKRILKIEPERTKRDLEAETEAGETRNRKPHNAGTDSIAFWGSQQLAQN